MKISSNRLQDGEMFVILRVDKTSITMTATTLATRNRIDRITLLVTRLAARQQQELERQLELLLLREEALALEKSVAKNDITMKEIVEEVRKARHGQ